MSHELKVVEVQTCATCPSLFDSASAFPVEINAPVLEAVIASTVCEWRVPGEIDHFVDDFYRAKQTPLHSPWPIRDFLCPLLSFWHWYVKISLACLAP